MINASGKIPTAAADRMGDIGHRRQHGQVRLLYGRASRALDSCPMGVEPG